MHWDTADIADAVHAGLQKKADADDLEQVVYGFDHLDELGLHPLIQNALKDAGYGVWPEQRYPKDWVNPKRSEGKRCDIVLTPPPGDVPLRDPRVKGTLFDTLAAVDAEDAYWLEIKTVAQHETSGPFARYSSEMLSPVTMDIKKLWTDGIIRHAGLLIVLFTEDQRVADHDLTTWHTRCLDRGFPVATPSIRGVRITNRIGNAHCTAALFGVRGV